MNPIQQSYFPKEQFNCTFEQKTKSPLVVSPVGEIDLVDWATKNQVNMAKAIHEYGAIAFSGFNLTKENFSKAFTAITGTAPEVYKGDTPREEVFPLVYKSTIGDKIPLHQEVAGGYRKNMPKYLSFFCEKSPTEGTGQTLVGNVKEITEEIKTTLPDLWKKLSTQNLTYTARYLPKVTEFWRISFWRIRLIQLLNRSHATIEKRFGTEDKEKIKKICEEQGLTCDWDGGWLVITRKGVPATIEHEGNTLFCNAIHLDKISPKLCGGWIKYMFARLLLYPTSLSMQFDVKFDDGTKICHKDTAALMEIFKKHQQARDWKKGDILLLDNLGCMHGKNTTKGDREILVAMSGSAAPDAQK